MSCQFWAVDTDRLAGLWEQMLGDRFNILGLVHEADDWGIMQVLRTSFLIGPCCQCWLEKE